MTTVNDLAPITLTSTTPTVESPSRLKRVGQYMLAYGGLLTAAMVVEGIISAAVMTQEQASNYTAFATIVGLVLTAVGIGMARNYRTGFGPGLGAFILCRIVATVIGALVQVAITG